METAEIMGRSTQADVVGNKMSVWIALVLKALELIEGWVESLDSPALFSQGGWE